MRIKTLATSLLVASSIFAASSASAITIGTYELSNHPDGNQSPPPYGLRLDGLLTGNSNEEYTFDFDHVLSYMTLTWDGTKIVIDGQAYGGEDNNNNASPGYVSGTTAVWDIHFEYTIGISQPGDAGGVDDLYVNADGMNFGTISSPLGSYSLEDKADNWLSFQLGDTANGSGHRGFSGISGWGWVNYGDDCVNDTCSHVRASDWLFTATLVPVPAAVWLFASGLLGLVSVARRDS